MQFFSGFFSFQLLLHIFVSPFKPGVLYCWWLFEHVGKEAFKGCHLCFRGELGAKFIGCYHSLLVVGFAELIGILMEVVLIA